MKEVTRTKTETIAKHETVFVAEDGTEFETEALCRRYETNCCYDALFEKHSEDFKGAHGWPPYNSSYGIYDNEYWWMCIADEDDIELIYKICSEVWCDLHFGDIVCIETDYCGERFCYSAKDTFNGMASFLKNFGFGVVKLEG